MLRQGSLSPAVRQEVMIPMMSCDTIKQALELPTLAQAVKRIGDDELLIMLSGAIEQTMQTYFSDEQRMTGAMCSAFADNLLSDYRYESIGDARVFLKRASMGRYGEIDPQTKEIINKGKTYGRITTALLGAWWEQYLGEKAEEAEKERLKSHKRHDAVIHESLAPALRKATEDEVERNEAQEVRKLVKYGHLLTAEQLREKWKKVKSAHARSLIIRLANEKGLVVKKIEEHLSKLETPKP